PIHPSSRGKGGCRGCRGYCACCPCRPAHADCAAPGPPPPPPRITACHPTPLHHTNTPPPPHGRAGQDITGVAVEEEGGGFPVCVSTALELFQRWTGVAQVTVGQVCGSPPELGVTVGFCRCDELGKCVTTSL